MKINKFILGFAVVAMLIVIGNLPGKKNLPSPGAPAAKDYTVISSKDIGMADRSKYEWRITAPGAVTFEERALTVMKAAEELRQKQMIQVARVILEPNRDQAGKGFAVAIAMYAIDGKGFTGAENKKWEV